MLEERAGSTADADNRSPPGLRPEPVSRSCARVGIVRARLHAVVEHGEVALHRLQQARAAGREIVVRDRRADRELLVIDHVYVGLHARLQGAAIVQAVEPRVAARLLLHQELERQAVALPIARPVGELGGRHGAVADQRDVSAGVGQAGHRVLVREHFLEHVHPVRDVGGRQRREARAAVADQEIVEVVERILAEARGLCARGSARGRARARPDRPSDRRAAPHGRRARTRSPWIQALPDARSPRA